MSDAPQIVDALDDVRLDAISHLARIAVSYWRSIELAAERGEAHLVILHGKQVTEVAREALEIIKLLGSEDAGP
jgi:hypothetical protein